MLAKSATSKTVAFRIFGRKFPGISFSLSQGALVHREPVYLGIQRGKEVVDLVRGDASRAVFNFSVDIVSQPKGELDFRGPVVHGKKGKKHLYLSWGVLKSDGSFEMFRRAVLHFSAIQKKNLRSAMVSDGKEILETTVDLTDDSGGPVCATIDSKVKWQIRRKSLVRAKPENPANQ
jgi:hypothetical protein